MFRGCARLRGQETLENLNDKEELKQIDICAHSSQNVRQRNVHIVVLRCGQNMSKPALVAK